MLRFHSRTRPQEMERTAGTNARRRERVRAALLSRLLATPRAHGVPMARREGGRLPPFDLAVSTDDLPGPLVLGGVAFQVPADPSASSIFTALPKQLGLRLEPGKGPVEVIVIDHVERPSAN
jgi:uncharacterized protein (TIGR03435 family)